MSNRELPNYFTVDDLKKVRSDAQYVFLLSNRNCGKSYATKSLCLQEAYNNIRNGHCYRQLAYMRRFDIDIKDSTCEPYFADMPVQEITNNEFTFISVYHKDIYFATRDEKTGRTLRHVKIGHCFPLSGAEHFKSLMYPDIYSIILEEVVSQNNDYLFNEPEQFQQAVSSILRDKPNCHAYLIGNTLSRMCPYYNDFGLKDSDNIDVGQTRVYHIDEAKIVVHRCEPVNYESKMYFGRARRNIVEADYITITCPHLPKKLSAYNINHKCVLEYDSFRYFLRLLTDPDTGKVFWYCEPLTTPLKDGTRIISNKWHDTIYHSYNFRGLTAQETAAFSLLIRDNLIVFSDNLTGTEFTNIISKFK